MRQGVGTYAHQGAIVNSPGDQGGNVVIVDDKTAHKFSLSMVDPGHRGRGFYFNPINPLSATNKKARHQGGLGDQVAPG
jgi:hypothetical protein